MMSKQPSNLTLGQVLENKEYRAHIQKQLREEYSSSVVSITLNIPGSIKYSKEWLGMLYKVEESMREACFLKGMTVLEERMIHREAGATFLMAIDGPAKEIKMLSVNIEESLSYGRLLDIDVFDASGEQINRAYLGLAPRKCFICSEAAAVCVRSMRHEKEEVIEAAAKLLDSYLTHDKPWRRIGKVALEAMLLEVAASPSPGLVDRFNSGAHSDMDIITFLKSSTVLSDYMVDFAKAGWEHQGTPKELFAILRHIGKKAEEQMLEATNGVNTQKGILFLLGVLTAAAGFTFRRTKSLTAKAVAAAASSMCEGIVEKELESLKSKKPERQLTAGEYFYLSFGFTGVRGEVESGLPTVFNYGLPFLKEALGKGLSENDALIHTLLALMSGTEDTTILHRHGIETLRKVQADAKQTLCMGGYYTAEGRQKVKLLDEQYSQGRISPGGSADLLAVTWFLYKLEKMLSRSDNSL